MKPKFTVILPTFNRKRELERCLQSIKEQSFQEYEIIVIDDGSGDGTDSFIAKNHPDVRYFYQKNQGVAKARNIGMEKANGQFFVFIDSDDTWRPNRLDVLRMVIDQLPNHVGLIFNDMDRLICGKGDGHSYSDDYFEVRCSNVTSRMANSMSVALDGRRVIMPYGDVFAELLNGNVIQPSCAILKKDVYTRIGGFREDFRVANDSEFFLRVSKDFQVAYVPLILTSLEPPRSSISLSLAANSIEKIKNTIKAIEGYWNAEKDGNLKKLLHKRLGDLHARLGYHYLSDFRFSESRFHYIKAARINTGKIKYYWMFYASFLPFSFLRIGVKTKRLLQKKI